MSSDTEIQAFVQREFRDNAAGRMAFDPDTGLSREDGLFLIGRGSWIREEDDRLLKKYDAAVDAWLLEQDAVNTAQQEAAAEERGCLLREFGAWTDQASRGKTTLRPTTADADTIPFLAAKDELEKLLDRMPPPYNVFLVLKYVDELEDRQIATLHSLPIGVVRKKVRIAMDWAKVIVAERTLAARIHGEDQ